MLIRWGPNGMLHRLHFFDVPQLINLKQKEEVDARGGKPLNSSNKIHLVEMDLLLRNATYCASSNGRLCERRRERAIGQLPPLSVWSEHAKRETSILHEQDNISIIYLIDSHIYTYCTVCAYYRVLYDSCIYTLQKCLFIINMWVICTHDTINPYKLRCMFNLNLAPWMQVESLAATVQRCSKLSSLFKIPRDTPKRVSTPSSCLKLVDFIVFTSNQSWFEVTILGRKIKVISFHKFFWWSFAWSQQTFVPRLWDMTAGMATRLQLRSIKQSKTSKPKESHLQRTQVCTKVWKEILETTPSISGCIRTFFPKAF